MIKLFRRITQPIRLIFSELKLVEWISARQTVQYTTYVLVISIMVGIMIITFDFVFLKARNVLFSI